MDESLSELESQLNRLPFESYSESIQDLLLAKELSFDEILSREEVSSLSMDKLLKTSESLGVYNGVSRDEIENRVNRIYRLARELSDRPHTPVNIPTVQSTTHNPFIVPDIDSIVGPKIKYLSHGSYAEVYQSEYGYAVKHSFDQDIDESILNEVRILRYLDHPNVINPVAIQLDPIKWALPLAHSDLSQVDLSTIEVRKLIFYQVFRAIDYIHHKRVWHLDIKPQNFLVFKVHDNTIVKLTDFGISKINLHGRKLEGVAVTLHWRAPEIEMNEPYDQSVDIWAAGIMLFNASGPSLTNTSKSISGWKLLNQIFKTFGTPSDEDWPDFNQYPNYQGYQATINWNDYDPDEAEVIKSCLTWPKLRKTANQILKLPYFDQYRSEIMIQLPANHIEEYGCLQTLQKYQIIIHGNNPYYTSGNRKKLINWIWIFGKNTKFSTETLFSAVMMMDIINDRGKIPLKSLQKYIIACLWIVSHYTELNTNLSLISYFVSHNVFTEREFDLAIRKVLTRLEFKLTIPNVWTFITEWGSDRFDDLELIAKKLILNYDYVKMYTPSQLAQICFEALDIDVSCLSSKRLYHSEIRDYLV